MVNYGQNLVNVVNEGHSIKLQSTCFPMLNLDKKSDTKPKNGSFQNSFRHDDFFFSTISGIFITLFKNSAVVSFFLITKLGKYYQDPLPSDKISRWPLNSSGMWAEFLSQREHSGTLFTFLKNSAVIWFFFFSRKSMYVLGSLLILIRKWRWPSK